MLPLALTVGAPAYAGSQQGRYENPDSCFAIVPPPGTTYTTSDEPNPNHGIGIDLSPTAHVYAGAESTDASTLDELLELESNVLFPRCSRRSVNRTKLGTLAAFDVVLSCPANREHPRPYTARRLLALAAPAGHGQYAYSIDLNIAHGDRAVARAEELFETLARSFTFLESCP